MRALFCGVPTVAYDWLDEFADWVQFFPEDGDEDGSGGADGSGIVGLGQTMGNGLLAGGRMAQGGGVQRAGGRLAAMAVASMYRDV